MTSEDEFTEEEKEFLKQKVTPEESAKIDKILENIRGMLIALS